MNNKDTCDINIRGWIITLDSDGFHYGWECGGTFGYIPTCRYVYNYDKKEWIQITSAELIEEYKVNLGLKYKAFKKLYKK